jgi:hypothetical protein
MKSFDEGLNGARLVDAPSAQSTMSDFSPVSRRDALATIEAAKQALATGKTVDLVAVHRAYQTLYA